MIAKEADSLYDEDGAAVISKSAGPLRVMPPYVQVVVAFAMPAGVDDGTVHVQLQLRDEPMRWYGNDLWPPPGYVTASLHWAPTGRQDTPTRAWSPAWRGDRTSPQ